MTWDSFLAIAAFALALGALILALSNRSSGDRDVTDDVGLSGPTANDDATEWAGADSQGEDPGGPGAGEGAVAGQREEKIVVVYNPVKLDDVDAVKETVREIALTAGIHEVTWSETSVDDPGRGQATTAVEEGATLVIAAGGDGTVRAVIDGLAGTGVPLGIIPAGTGNLLARNLKLPIGDVWDAVQTAITGVDTRIDVGFVQAAPLTDIEAESVPALEGSDKEEIHGVPPGPHAFAVLAGIGFDAAMVGDADSSLKDKVGWYAYGASAVKNMRGDKMEATLTAGSAEPQQVTARSIMVANCGKLPANLTLAIDARMDDGWLDLGILDTKGGLVGWADLARRIGMASVGIRRDGLPATGTIEFRRTRYVDVSTAVPQRLQLDGDVLGYASEITFRVSAGALLVRS